MKQPAEIRPRDLLISFRFLLIAAIILVVALIIDPLAHLKEPEKVNTHRLERDFHRKIKNLESVGNEILAGVVRYGWPGVLAKDPGFTNRYSKDDDGIALFVLQRDSMVFWSDNSLVVGTKDLLQMESSRVYTLPNCTVYARVYLSDQTRVVGVVFLKKFFPYNNELVSNAFLVGKNIPESYKISIPPLPGAIRISDDQGKYAFSLLQSNVVTSRKTLHWLTLMLYFISFAFILLFYNDIMRLAVRMWQSGWWLLALLADLLFLRWVLWHFRVPHCIFNLPLFDGFIQPHLFLESRGDVLISAVLLILFAFWFSKYFELFPGRKPALKDKKKKWGDDMLALSGWVLAFLCFLGTTWLIRHLLLQRPGFLELQRILTLNFSSILDTLMIVGILIALILILYRLINRIRSRLSLGRSMFGLGAVLACGLLIESTTQHNWIGLLFFLLLSLVILWVQKSHRPKLSHGLVTVILVLISGFMVYSIAEVNKTKEKDQHNTILSKLSSEHDQIAEMLLT